jgi:hypothetical protein
MKLSKEEKRRLKSGQQLPQKEIILEATVPMHTETLTVLCVRFGPLYSRDYVVKLKNMISRNLTVPYKFVCLTDDQHPIDGVEIIYQPNSKYKKGWWHKVHMFNPELPLSGRILYFDLDVIIHKNIDKLVANYSNDFLGIRDFNRKFHPSWQYLNSSVMSWIHLSQTPIWEEYKKDIVSAQRLQGDQDWIWKIARNKIKFWPDHWIQSYKWEIRSRNDLYVSQGRRKFKIISNNTKIHPEECCVAVFHGDPKPQDIDDKFVVDNWR